MKVQSQLKYKSVDPLKPFEFPNFVILTGLNGSGKSQLLEGIINKAIELNEENTSLDPKKLVTSVTLSPNNDPAINSENLKQSALNAFNPFNNYLQQKQTKPSISWKESITDGKQRKIILEIAKNAKKEVDDLTADDFLEHYPLDDGLGNSDIFYHRFSTIFKSYQVKLFNNEVNEFRHQQKGKTEVKYLSEVDFKEKYGDPPWIFVNNILKEANLDYHINSPENQNPHSPFQLKLINNFNNAEINFSDLSSGEKVLMSLALALYNSKLDREFPKVLLMDEADASLHPSMVKQFLNVIQNVFVAQKEVRVIMTTHSPSTVALAPEECLYVMNKTEPRLEKTSKDRALKILTAGVPSLSISYENRRQVFVESKYDVHFYDKVYDKLRERLIQEVSINFIASGNDGAGNCEQVKDIVNKLAGLGNKTIYGIVDWDLKNNGNDWVKVLGKDKRYSIENYIFDPLLLGAYLLQENYVTRETLGLEKNENYIDFKHFDNVKLECISRAITNKIKLTAHDGSEDEEKMMSCALMNGKAIEIPDWFLLYKGHDLEEKVKSAFPQLKKFQKEGELKREIIDKTIDNIPEILSIDILELLKEIQNIES